MPRSADQVSRRFKPMPMPVPLAKAGESTLAYRQSVPQSRFQAESWQRSFCSKYMRFETKACHTTSTIRETNQVAFQRSWLFTCFCRPSPEASPAQSEVFWLTPPHLLSEPPLGRIGATRSPEGFQCPRHGVSD